MRNEQKLILVSCGILKKEINTLIRKNEWPVEAVYLNSSLHIDFEKLSRTLHSTLDKFDNRQTFIFYGACHPLMDKFVEDYSTIRTSGQNCAEMLLGQPLFTDELSKGAYFLLEDWALRWDEIISKTFGTDQKIIKAIFKSDRSYLLALRTPCSGNFQSQAEYAGKTVGLPVRWMDVSLTHLETVLQTTISERLKK